jgi:hypothetical protein
MRLISRSLAFVTVLFLIPASAWAQASLTGVVRDTSGGVMPGVTVEAASAALIERVRTTVTDSGGLYRIVDLRPGTYTLTFSLPGFTTVQRERLELAGAITLTINTELRVGTLQETLTVSGATPVVDLQNARTQTVLDADVIAALPATRAYGALLNAIPGVTVDNNGLAMTPTMTFFSSHGGPSNEGKMTINGMGVGAASGGGGVGTLIYDTNNAEEMSVLVSGGMGESDTGGPVVNLVPRSGGNTFSGQSFYSTAGEWSSGDNLDDFLRGIGIREAGGVINSYDASVALGGPVMRDRVWFYGGYRKISTAQAVEGIFGNVYALDPSHWDYLRDDSISVRDVQGRDAYQARFTGQVTPKNRVSFSQENQYRCQGSTVTMGGDGCRGRGDDWVAMGSTTLSPEASDRYFEFPYWLTQGTWTSTASSRLLIEAGFSRLAYPGGAGTGSPDGARDLIQVVEQAGIDGHPANYGYRGMDTTGDSYQNIKNWRAAASYVTGSHAMKVGYQGGYQRADVGLITGNTGDSQLTYRFNNRVPNQFTFRLPDWRTRNVTMTSALFVQDTFTRGRLSLQGALRYDRAWSWSPAEGNGTEEISPFNAAPITFERTASVDAFNDISPRGGAAYDVFGNGRTAVKFVVGRYLAPATNDNPYIQNNPASRIVNNASRSWADGNANYRIDCDILNPAMQVTPGGDTCGALTGNALNFGKAGNNLTQVNPEILSGWGVRRYDWQWGVSLQQELLPRVSLDAEYNRRSFGNYTVTDNRARVPADYEAWTINAPLDERLPDGGGYPIVLYTPTAAAAALAAQNYVTFETDFGPARTHYWQGIDLTLRARLGIGLTLQGGTSTGRTIIDTCESEVNIDSPDTRNCRNEEPFQTTLRGLASYTIPKVDVLISSTVRSQPAVQLNANWNVPNTVVQTLLGRVPPGALPTGNTTVALLDNEDNRLYADNRRTQLDMRFAKILRFGRTRTDIGVDLYNVLNTNYALTYEGTYSYTQPNGGTWQNPTSILAPRFARFNITVNY